MSPFCYGITVVLIHYMDEAAKSHRVVAMDDGKGILDGTSSHVFSHLRLLQEMGLDVPQATEPAHELRKAGDHLPPAGRHSHRGGVCPGLCPRLWRQRSFTAGHRLIGRIPPGFLLPSTGLRRKISRRGAA